VVVDLSEVEGATESVTPAVESEEPASRLRPWLRRVGMHLGVIAVFTLPAVVLWWRAWSVGAASTVRCACLDPAQQVWFIAWPAHALANVLSPFSSMWLWPPHGVNLLANASAPLVGIVLSPITWWFGPLAATTLALTLAPGLTAWGCWVACRRLVTWQPAWWVAGFVFGYSPFVVQSVAQGHLSTGLLVIPPLVLVALHEIMVRQRASVWWCGISLAALLLAQFLISAEVLTMMVLLGVVGIVVTIVLNPHRVAAQLPYALRAFGVAGLASLVLLAAPVWYMLAGPQRIKGAVWSGEHTFFVAQAFSLWDPGTYRLPLWSEALQGPPLQFLGFGLLVVLAVSVAVAWRRRGMWVIAIVALVATVFSWGGILWLSPHHPVYSNWLPWTRLTNLPVLNNITAVHFSAFADLGVALIIAIGLDALRWSRPGQWLPAAARIAVLAAATALMMVPIWLTFEAPLAVDTVELPPWYATAAHHVPAGSVVTSYPFPASASVTSQPMLWQAADGMRFRLAGGYVKVPGPGNGVIGQGPPGSATRTLDELTLGSGFTGVQFTLTSVQLENLRSALRTWRTSYIVVSNLGAAPTEAAAMFTAATGTMPRISHGAWVWDLRAHPLRAPYGAAAAARAFEACVAPPAQLGGIAPGQPLPQTLNQCVAAGTLA
jgi:hypothetical protein